MLWCCMKMQADEYSGPGPYVRGPGCSGLRVVA